MSNIWELGDWRGYPGDRLNVARISCPFCFEKGNFEFEHDAIKSKSQPAKQIHFSTLKCGNCAGYVLVMWSVSFTGDVHDFIALPTPNILNSWPEHWDSQIGNYWLEAHRNFESGQYLSAVLMARSVLQLSLRLADSTGTSLKAEINNLASKGVLPPLMK